MSNDTKNLHGSVPDKHEFALLLIDVISDFDFPDGTELLKNAEPIIKNIAALRDKARKAKVPIVYVNDNFGKWKSDFNKLLKHCQGKSAKGSAIANLLAPHKDDYFVLKPKHSGFYSTTLELLLVHLNAKKLILAGFSTDICILFTASDAYLRNYKLFVPNDCVTSNDLPEHEHTLKYIERVLKADTRPFKEIKF